MTPDQRAVFNAAYRVGAALNRKFETSDLTPELRQAAQLFAASYGGDFDFMLAMRDQATLGGYWFNDNQSKSILNCLMAEAKRRLAAKAPKPAYAGNVPAAAAPQTHVTLAIVPDGRYRVTLPDGESIALYIKLAGQDSKLAGSRVVSTRSGGDEWMGVAHIAPHGDLRIWRSCQGSLRDRVRDAVNILDAAERQDDWLVAGLAFAQEGSQCFICGRDLDTRESLTAGYGPTCAEKHGLPWGAKAIPMSVRLAQASAATVEAPAEPHIDPETGAQESADELLDLVKTTRPAEAKAVDPAIAHAEYQRRTLAQARAEGRSRTYEEIFGEDS
jgi:hypothetical protein